MKLKIENRTRTNVKNIKKDLSISDWIKNNKKKIEIYP